MQSEITVHRRPVEGRCANSRRLCSKNLAGLMSDPDLAMPSTFVANEQQDYSLGGAAAELAVAPDSAQLMSFESSVVVAPRWLRLTFVGSVNLVL